MRVLIFGTTYIDSTERLRLVNQWIDINERLNPDCDLLIVDTPCADYPHDGMDLKVAGRRMFVHRFGDNIGHMGRHGRDGWGRAFCEGIAIAIRDGYDYVAHIEGDSLFRLKVKPICDRMWQESIHVASIPVMGTKVQEKDWVETGLMVMSVAHIKKIDFIEKYDWPAGGKLYQPDRNTPERVIHRILGGDLTMMPWRGQRDQARRLKADQVAGLDWLTQTTPEFFDAFHSSVITAADYTSRFFEMHETWRDDYRTIADIFVTDMPEGSVIDLGCGNGYIIERLRERGYSVTGVDGSPEVRKHWPEALIHDLTKPLDVIRTGTADSVVCTEVAEHLPHEAADQLVDNICNSAAGESSVIFFSAAKAGRGGEHHLNEQPAEYWVEKFNRRGFYLDIQASMDLRWEIAERTSATWWFAVNLMVFRRG